MKKTKTILITSFAFLFFGAITTFATWPTVPEGSVIGGWLGEVFDVIESGDKILSVKSKILIIPTEIADINQNKQVPTKEYVDSRVAAIGGGNVVINGSTMPTMISALSLKQDSWGHAAAYCANLNEEGYSDWRMPIMNELFYAVLGGINQVVNDSEFLWTASMADHSITGEINRQNDWIILKPSNISWTWNGGYGKGNHVRCVR